MPAVTSVIGIMLTLLGLIGYFATNRVSVTALIPAFFGVVLIGMGLLAMKEGMRKHAMHVAVALALLGFIGSVPGLLKLPTLLANGEVARPAAVVSQSIMAALCIILVILGVRSFIAARRQR